MQERAFWHAEGAALGDRRRDRLRWLHPLPAHPATSAGQPEGSEEGGRGGGQRHHPAHQGPGAQLRPLHPLLQRGVPQGDEDLGHEAGGEKLL